VTILAATILDSVAGTLLDTAHRTWSADELLDYLNEALRTTAGARPDMYTVQDFVVLAGGPLQELPDDGIELIDITRNFTGRVVTQVDKGLLDEAERFWPRATQVPQVEHYTLDPRNPRRYKVFPPNDGFGSVEVLYSAIPPQVMYDSEEIAIPASYQTPLINFVLAKAYMKNAKRQDLAKSSGYLAQWGQGLGLSASAMTAVLPKVSATPGT
jgi:hypothetical protein